MRTKLMVVIVILCVLLVSCSIPYDIPYGKWQNEEHGLMLDIDPKQEEHYFGTYLANDENIDIFIMFAYEKSFSIYDCKYFDFVKNEWLTTADKDYFCGLFNVKNDKLYYTLKPHWQELTGITDTIVFEKIEDYESDGE